VTSADNYFLFPGPDTQFQQRESSDSGDYSNGQEIADRLIGIIKVSGLKEDVESMPLVMAFRPSDHA
jgi:hypothetical protein